MPECCCEKWPDYSKGERHCRNCIYRCLEVEQLGMKWEEGIA